MQLAQLRIPKPYSIVPLNPSREAIKLIFGHFGYSVREIDWSPYVQNDESLADYYRGERATFLLSRPVDPSPIGQLVVPGRLEVRGRRPLEIWDGAHNPAGMQRLAAELPALLGDRQAVAVFAAMADKDVASMVSLLRTVCPSIIATTSTTSSTNSLPPGPANGFYRVADVSNP